MTDRAVCDGHEWMANPDIIMSDKPVDQIPPYVCRHCDSPGFDCPGCLGNGCLHCAGSGIVEEKDA